MTFYGDYALKCPFDMLTKDKGGIPNDVARLPGVRLAVCSEIPGGSAINECLVKEITGGDRLTARFLHHEYFEFNPSHKVLVVGNHRPRVRGGDHGIWRRILLVPFDNTIAENERRDMRVMIDEFMAESSGILNWALQGLKDFWANGLIVPERARIASAEYQADEDALGDFLGGYTERSDGNETQGSLLYSAYKASTEQAGGQSMSNRSFYDALRERGYSTRKCRDGKRVIGLRLTKDVM
jgi:putative DNA primase/helicase